MRHHFNFLSVFFIALFAVATTGCSKGEPVNAEATLEAHIQGTLKAISAVDGTVEAGVQATAFALPSPAPPATPVSSIIPPAEKRSLSFAGYNWQVKSSEGRVGPGPNFFSDREENVFVDEEGRLYLKIVNRDGQWYATEVINTENLGYGLYTFYLVTPVDQLDPNIVLGLFTWDDNAPEENYREIDIEFSRWGQPENDNAQYVVQPWDKTANIHRFNVALDNQISTHSFLWQPDGILFQSSYGHQTDTPFPADIQSWFYEGYDNHPPGDENIRINLWLRNGEAPLDGQDSEVIISNFTFIPPSTPIPPTPVLTTESGGAPSIEVTSAVTDSVSGVVRPTAYCNDNYRVVIYAKTDIWYVQPFTVSPLTMIRPGSCNWESFTHPWNELVVFLVPASYDPPSTLSSQSCPPNLPGVEILASSCYRP